MLCKRSQVGLLPNRLRIRLQATSNRTTPVKPKDALAQPSAYVSMAYYSLMGGELIHTFKRPVKPIIIYEYDSCAQSKKVREIVNYLDLDVLIKPCPLNGPNFRQEVWKKGGKAEVPYMEDPNTGEAMYEADTIVQYLANTYGDGTLPPPLQLGPITDVTCELAGLARFGMGTTYKPSRMPEKPLILWGYEAGPFVRLVRESITELELPHLLVTTAHGSPKRQAMFEKYGHFQVPLLEDPNTKVALFESDQIIQYLEDTYGAVATVKARVQYSA